MRIVVPIKQVPETSNVKMDPVTGTMVRTGVEAIINPLDLYAIEVALRLREQQGGEVVVITMGPPSAEKALREACAMGCDTAILLSDKRYGGADTWATSYTLARAIRKLGMPDLLVCGERATDGDTGQVGPGIAAFLQLPLATYVSRVEMLDGEIRAWRLVEGGTEVLRLPLPALLTVVKDVASPRLPTLHGMQRAKKITIPVWQPEDIEADLESIGLNGSPTRVVKIYRPQVTRSAEIHRIKEAEDMDKAAGRLVEYLQDRNIF